MSAVSSSAHRAEPVLDPKGDEAVLVVKNIRMTASQAWQLRLRSFRTYVPEAAIVREALDEYFYRHRNDPLPEPPGQ